MDDGDDEDRPGVARIEFSEGEEASLGRLASALGLVGTLQILLASAAVVLALIGLLLTLGRMPAVVLAFSVLALLSVGVPVWQGMLLREAGEAIGRVAGSDEDDQEYLASAFRRLRTIFVIELALTLYTVYKAMA